MSTGKWTGWRVIINRNGHPKTDLRNVQSFSEISDEANETIAGIALYVDGHWREFPNNTFDRMTIELEYRPEPILQPAPVLVPM